MLLTRTFLSPQASFVAAGNRTDISLEDPDFWQKWAKKAELDMDAINGRVTRTLFLLSRGLLDITLNLSNRNVSTVSVGTTYCKCETILKHDLL